jgi:hypothetical protein
LLCLYGKYFRKKEKIFTALKAAVLINGKTSISDKTLNTYVDSISEKITDESQITEAITPHVTILKEIQANINAVAAESVSTTKTEYEKRIKELEGKTSTPPVTTPPDDITSQIKAALSEALSPLQEKLAAIETEKTQKTFLQKLGEQLETGGIPEWYSKNAVSGREFKTEEDVTRFANTLKTEWEAAKQQLAEAGFQGAKPPVSGAGAADESSAIVSLIEKGTKEIVEQSKKQ